MADNSERCSNCGTENPEGADFCVKCHQPLTASAEEGIRENQEAQEHGGLFAEDGIAGRSAGLGGVGGMLTPIDITPDDATQHGLPPRRS
jgi:zinc-ribbon domain